MTLMRASVGFLLMTPVVMLIALMAHLRWAVVGSAVLGLIASIGVLAALVARRRWGVRAALTGLGAAAAGAGHASWFFLDDAAINLAGPAAVVVGTLVVAVATPRSGPGGD